MREKIQEELRAIESKKGITVLYACESGSRAWGFPSLDSDYDARFIFAYPTEHYLSIAEPPDVIDWRCDELLDINGWELRKALRLMAHGNAVPFEWLQSPIVYLDNNRARERIWSAVSPQFQVRRGAGHYLGLGGNAWRDLDDTGEVRAKRYCYALRAALAARWTVEQKQCPPMELSHLRELIASPQAQTELDSLLAAKAGSTEQQLLPRPKLLDEVIQHAFASAGRALAELDEPERDAKPFDAIFRALLSGASK